MKEIKAIKQALAAGPTPGEWAHDADCSIVFSNDGDEVAVLERNPTGNYRRQVFFNGEYIAACNPDAMSKVLTHIEAQNAEIAAYDISVAEYRQQCIDNHAEIERLRAESDERLKNTVSQAMEIERLKADAERYRWLRNKTPWTAVSAFNKTRIAFRLAAKFSEKKSPKPGVNLDTAIDTAMKETP